MLFVSLTLLALTAAVTNSAEIRQCESSAAIDLKNIEITGCGSGRDCIFKKGQNAEMKMTFIPKYPATKVKAVVHGIIFNVPIPFSLPHANACQYAGLTCPLEPGTKQVYTAVLPVKKIYPSLRVTVRWQLMDENNHPITCIKFPVRLQ